MEDYTKPRAREMRGWIIRDESRDALLTQFGKSTLDRSYLMPGETYQDAFARVAGYYADDSAHAQRLYDYISKQWFMPATPVLSNGGTTRGLPISCFLNDVGDSIEEIVETWNENVWLARYGGGIGTYWGDVRSIGESVKGNGKTTGVVPFIKVQDSLTLAISQGSLRRGSAALYLPVWHPEIEEFIEIRRPTGGDPNRKALNLHNAVVVDDKFMQAVEQGCQYDLLSPKTGLPIRTVNARDLWAKILQARMETGEPYILFIDTVNRAIPEHHKALGLTVKQSNLCIEITLPTGYDHHGHDRTAVCCLSSLNLARFDEWSPVAEQFIEDVMRFLDNVMQDFIDTAPPEFAKAVYSAARERSVGLGVMGFHTYLQQNGVPFESDAARNHNRVMHETIKRCAERADFILADERGPCPDAIDAGMRKRFSNKTAHAPTASISIICGTVSPSTEPVLTNIFTQKTLSGSFPVKNQQLEALLESKGMNTKEVWSDILINEGSVQHLEFLTEHEKKVFKTAFEIDQRWVVQHAADRQPFIDQSQSTNLFLRPDIHKLDLHQIHMAAWKLGVKSLYYCRSQAIRRAEKVNLKVARLDEMPVEEVNKYEVCEACT